MLYKKDGPIDLVIVKEMLTAMHDVRVKVDRELLLLNLEKKLVSKHHEYNGQNRVNSNFSNRSIQGPLHPVTSLFFIIFRMSLMNRSDNTIINKLAKIGYETEKPRI
jgi:hypothetical protein